MAVIYYSMFDPARLAGEVVADLRRERLVRACGSGMFDVLVGGHALMFSQTQVFDSAWLLETVASGNAEAQGLRKLIQRNWIQTKIFVPDQAHTPSGVEPYSVRGAFLRALDTPGFTFSAWPELSDPEVRKAVRAQIMGDTKEPLPEPLEMRLVALLMLDQHFTESTASEVGHAGAPSESLEVMIRREIRRRSERLSSWTSKYAGLDELADSATGDEALSLDRRSDWYTLIKRRLADAKADDNVDVKVAEVWRGVVDVQYNRRVAGSLGAQRARMESDEPSLALVLEGMKQVHDEEMTASASVLGGQLGLTWATAAEMLEDEQPVVLKDPASVKVATRARDLRIQALITDRVAREVDDSRLMLTSRKVLGPSVGVAAGLAGDSFVIGVVATLVGNEVVEKATARVGRRLLDSALKKAEPIRSASLLTARRYDP